MSIGDRISKGTLQLARFIRDLLDYDEQLIKIGETNFEREDFKLSYIVPDEISSATISRLEKFDDVGEVIGYTIRKQGSMTIDFYGDQAYSNMINFEIRIKTQKGYELQRDMGLTVFNPTGETNLDQLTGVQYSPRFQIALNLRYNETVNVPTLRIDTAQTSIITN